ncbi:uncharacterized protein At1g65710-like [Cynara cardunculus var. scolymus]|uniref:uncharacterized protein At1g65710-like n=1 Tax=Cynara cardunculus var. scolymus TaxID=59895 RepID=UPI000D62EC8E|nr:uncharacterized protein At1g65710-like [Cynara cardunculus var. scolymus]
MGSCFSKNNTTAALTTTSQQLELKSNPPQPQNPKTEQVVKKEIFVIKHRISHEIDRRPNEDDPNLLNPSAVAGTGGGARVRTSSCSKEEVDAILIQCGRLSRSNSAGAENPRRRRRYSGSKRSFDFDLNMGLKNDDDDGDDEALNHHHRRRHRQQGSRVSSPSSRRSSRERDFRQQRSGNGGRRISISPSRRSESPICSNSNGGPAAAAAGGGSTRPMKMVPVPATDKSNNVGGNAGSEQVVGGGVKRIHVKRNVAVVSRTAASPPRSRSPVRTNLRILSDDQSQEQWRQEINTRVAGHSPYKRKSLAEIDNNAARSVQAKMVDEAKMVAMVENLKLHQNIKRTQISRRSEDLDMNPETIFDPSPPSYTSLLLEDIHNFHQKNTNSAAIAAATEPPPFSLPACVSKACSIMEAVADLNSNSNTATTSSLFSDDSWRNPTPIERYINKDRFIESETVVNGSLMEPSLQNYITVRRGGSATTEEQESSDSNSFASSQRLSRKSPSVEPNSANLTTRKCEMNPLGDFQSKLLDRPRKGIGRGRKSAYPTPEITTIAST